MFFGPLDFIFDGSTVQLDLHDVRLLLTLLQQLHLGVSNDADHSAVTDDLLEVFLDGLASEIVLPFLGGLGEGLLLGFVPD